MEKSNEVDLGSVQETLLGPLWMRAMETQKERPIFIDHKAVSLVNSIPYDFSLLSKNSSSIAQRLTHNGVIAKTMYYDEKIKAFIDSYPKATIVNIGCGLDTTFYRVDNGKIQWIDLDMPDVIDLRREYFTESDRNRFIAKSVFDTGWYDSIDNKDSIMLLIAGVLFFFDESQVKRLFQDFQTHLPGAEIVFEAVSKLMVKIFNRMVISKGGMEARAIWGISNINAMEKWGYGLEVIEIGGFAKYKRYFPLIDRIIISIAQLLKLGYVAHVKIHPR